MNVMNRAAPRGSLSASSADAGRRGTCKPYKHRDLSFVVDLGWLAGSGQPAARPAVWPLANVITRGYHLYACRWTRRFHSPRAGLAAPGCVITRDVRG